MNKVIITALVVFAAILAHAQSKELEPESVLLQLRTGLDAEREAAANALTASRQQIVKELIAVVETQDADKASGGSLHRAIDVLGEFRATEGLEALTSRITFSPNEFVLEVELPQEYRYVAAVAILRIGEPCRGFMLRTIESSNDPTSRRLAAWVLLEVFDKSLAATMLRDLVRNEREARLKANYAEAIEFIENYQPKLEPMFPGLRPIQPGEVHTGE